MGVSPNMPNVVPISLLSPFKFLLLLLLAQFWHAALPPGLTYTLFGRGCRDIDADVLVDDNPVYAIECASSGVHVVLYDWQRTYPWSKLPRGYVRCCALACSRSGEHSPWMLRMPARKAKQCTTLCMVAS